MAGVTEHFARSLIGNDPMQIGRIWEEMYRSAIFESGRVIIAAMSAPGIALYDIVGKQRDRAPSFASAGADPVA